MRASASTVIALLVVTVLGLGGCAMSMAPAAAGVTTGGVQDIGLARSQVAAGEIPQPEAFRVEGLLDEHDLDIGAPPCERAFCLTTATSVAPALDTGSEAAFVVLGLSSGIDLATFRRNPLNLAVVVDRSGSMEGGKLEAVRHALHRLLDQLGPQDRLSIVLFDDQVDVLVPSRPLASETGWIHGRLDRIFSRGSTDLESGLAEGYAQVLRHSGQGRSDRVIVFTDAQPNTGRTDQESFLGLARSSASRGVGLTVFGVGLDLGQTLTVALSEVPGANSFFLEDEERIATVFDQDFDLLVTPVAWDFEVVVRPSPEYRVVAAYGVPSWDGDQGDGAVRIRVPTLFLSRNRGAIVLRLEPTGLQGSAWQGPLAVTALSFKESLEAQPLLSQGTVQLGEAGGDGGAGAALAVTLVNTALGLRGAAQLAQQGRFGEALSLLDRIDPMLASGELSRERTLVADLRRLLQERLPGTGKDPA